MHGFATTTIPDISNSEEVCTTAGITSTYYSAGGHLLAEGVNGAISYLATDGLGSAVVALDGSGNATASTLYDPYGQAHYTNGAMPGSRGFTGQHSDSTTGLDYYNARYYDAVAGQFVSADSVQAGLNRYDYVGGNPETRIDPSGHMMVSGDGGAGSPPPPPPPPPPPQPTTGSSGSGHSSGHSSAQSSRHHGRSSLSALVVLPGATTQGCGTDEFCEEGPPQHGGLLSLMGYDVGTIYSVGYEGAKKLRQGLEDLEGKVTGEFQMRGLLDGGAIAGLTVITGLVGAFVGLAVVAGMVADWRTVEDNIVQAVRRVDHYLQMDDNASSLGDTLRVYVSETGQLHASAPTPGFGPPDYGELEVWAETDIACLP